MPYPFPTTGQIALPTILGGVPDHAAATSASAAYYPQRAAIQRELQYAAQFYKGRTDGAPDDERMKAAISLVQVEADLPVTGVYDEAVHQAIENYRTSAQTNCALFNFGSGTPTKICTPSFVYPPPPPTSGIRPTAKTKNTSATPLPHARAAFGTPAGWKYALGLGVLGAAGVAAWYWYGPKMKTTGSAPRTASTRRQTRGVR